MHGKRVKTSEPFDFTCHATFPEKLYHGGSSDFSVLGFDTVFYPCFRGT